MENKYTQLVSNGLDRQDVNRIKRKGDKQSFRQRLRGVFRFCVIASVVLQVVSVATETLYTYQGIYRISVSSVVAIIGCLFVVAIIEGTKRYSVPHVARAIVGGWLKEHRAYLTAFSIACFLAICSLGASVYLSIYGASDIAEFINKQRNSPTLVNLDSIRNHYDGQIADLSGSRDSEMAANRNSRGQLLIQSGVPVFEQYSQEIDQLQVERATALAAASAENDRRMAAHEKDTAAGGNFIQGFAGICELFFVVFIFFAELYDRTSYLELSPRKKTTSPHSISDVEPQRQSTVSPYSDQSRNKAGFKDYQKQPVTAVKQNKQPKTKTDVRYLKQRCTQTYRRSVNSASEQARISNKERFEGFKKQLQKLGVDVVVSDNGQIEYV